MKLAGPQAIVDIGSNSIRLVVFGGAARAPVVLYNEKVMAGLGRGVIETGALDPEGMAVALAGLDRFAGLIAGMDLASLRVVATAAVREASNGPDFVKQVQALGLPVEVLDGEAEANAAGYGVISAMPWADGLVADMGGGSLELVRVSGGAIGERASFRLGALRVAAIRARGKARLQREVDASLKGLDWLAGCRGRPLYLVGGTWRSLSRVHMELYGYPLPVIGNYTFAPGEAKPLLEAVIAMDKISLKSISQVKSARIPYLEDGAALLDALVSAIGPSEVSVSAFGLREGLLYASLTTEQQARDPLVEGMRYLTEAQQQFPGYAEALHGWLDGLFPGEPPEWRRVRLAACLLRGTGWSSNPDFRALSGEELALHGAWSGASAADRAMLAMAVFVGMGGGSAEPDILARLAGPDQLARARAWGYAMRLAQRVSGGVPDTLRRSAVRLADGQLVLSLPRALDALVDATLERRLARCAESVGSTAPRVDFIA
ncbi:MAG: Ppx/GppA family phosphatase [Sphingomonadales bacterium]|nr:Ppx/GppA family phosphatase [Sphingomonadales bacterium]MDE2569060.1 Ppx/GppA family phosphatase [Sphingomonadales bacterium]